MPENDDLAGLERAHVEELARAHAALAQAQDRGYWLDRWGIDLNALMRRRGAAELRAAVRALRDARRLTTKARRKAKASLASARAEIATEQEVRGAGTAATSARFRRSFSPRRLESAPVTQTLFARLEEADLQMLNERLSDSENAMLGSTDSLDRLRALISLGVHHGIPSICERTGLSGETPPEDVHAMARGSLAAGGSLYYADLIVDALATAGTEIEDGMRCLDFGCSSGRVVRALAAAYPGSAWNGCDPIESAVTWARAHLPGIDFAHSPERPPLPYGDGELDLAFAISIWSHFAEPDAIAWLDEMHRILRPGGTLLLTTHGLQTLAHDEVAGVRLEGQLEEIQAALYKHGFWFKNEFGEGGDYGVDNSGWGTAFLTPEWLLWATAGKWRVATFAPGRVEDNQDLFVLERR